VIISVVEERSMLVILKQSLMMGGGFFRAGWQLTARALSPVQFLMRFPNTKEVEHASYWGKEWK
jgi:hypothetical protein